MKSDEEIQQRRRDWEEEAMTIDSLVDTYFNEESQRRRFKIEMSELCESQNELGINVRLDGSPYHRQLGVIISIDLTKIHSNDSTNNDSTKNTLNHPKIDNNNNIPKVESLTFEIQPHYAHFPLKSTRIYSLDKFKGLNDGRDYLRDVLGHPWHSSVTLIEIVESLLAFVQQLLKNAQDPIYLQRLGKYYIGQTFLREHLQRFHSQTLIPTTLYASQSLNKPSTGLIAINDYSLCIYEVVYEEQSLKKKEYLKLTGCSDLQSIVEIKRNISNKSIIHIRYQSETSNPPYNFQHSLRVNDSEKLLRIILEKVCQLQKIKVWSNAVLFQNTKFLRDSKLIVQEKLTERMFYQEEQFKLTRSPENYKRITHTYSDLIEHYSSVNDFILTDYFLKAFHKICSENEELNEYLTLDDKQIKEKLSEDNQQKIDEDQMNKIKLIEENVQHHQEQEEKEQASQELMDGLLKENQDLNKRSNSDNSNDKMIFMNNHGKEGKEENKEQLLNAQGEQQFKKQNSAKTTL